MNQNLKDPEIPLIEAAARLDFALQPIVNIHTGNCLGYEALLRGFENLGFKSPSQFFDNAFLLGTLADFDILLREKAIAKFCRLDFHGQCKLFYNLDNRILQSQTGIMENTKNILQAHGIGAGQFCLEVSERHELPGESGADAILGAYHEHSFHICMDDFGIGFSGLQTLYRLEPDFIKIDRFFIGDVHRDPKKKLFVSKIINLAHILGIMVIAEGVETLDEFYECRDMACDYFQGYFIQRPSTETPEMKASYSMVPDLNKKSRRRVYSDHTIVTDQIEYIEPISIHADSLTSVFEAFRTYSLRSFFPVINELKVPVGIIREKDLKVYAYSLYGRDLLNNHSLNHSVTHFVSACPVCEINRGVESILELFIMDGKGESEGVIITDSGRYVGFLSASSLLKVLNEKNLAMARDQNPLTKLPGNNLINDYISRTLPETGGEFVYAYFDINDFKPFNDKYGFREGDRIILLFSDILKASFLHFQSFVGHIGGDDFFVGSRVKEAGLEAVFANINTVIARFSHEAVSFYNETDRDNGFIFSVDRNGQQRQFPLLSVSAGLLRIRPGRSSLSIEHISAHIAAVKKESKAAANHVAVYNL
jgi:EAL domain-containing protein (putative c-di-GMP-specific phosphodiesterase class I)/GGDEF domain-containing protein